MTQKNILFWLFLSLSLTLFSQQHKEKTHGLFYKASLSTTLKINETNSVFENDDEPFFNFSALFVSNALGYQLDKRTSIAANLEYHWHSQQGLHFLPSYVSLRHNVITDDYDNFFIRGGYGTLLGISQDFQKGNLYKLGLGIQFLNADNDNSFLLGLDFTRKRFDYRTLDGLSSISIFLEFMLF